MKLRKIRIARKLIAETFGVGRAKVLVNPSATAIINLVKSGRCDFCPWDVESIVRLLYDVENDDLYVWCAHAAIHEEIIKELGIPKKKALRFAIEIYDIDGKPTVLIGPRLSRNSTINRLRKVFPNPT